VAVEAVVVVEEEAQEAEVPVDPDLPAVRRVQPRPLI
jgi:hypothetical protein